MARKLNAEKIAKAARVAIGVGNLVLCCTDPKLRKRVKSAIEQIKSPNPNPPAPAKSQQPASEAPPAGGEGAGGVVYLLQAGPFFKIGKATDLNKRVRQIKLQLPYPVTVVHKIQSRDITCTERFWHKRFASQRAHGEWFTLNDAEVAEFKSYSAM